jgi:hypothetical protein
MPTAFVVTGVPVAIGIVALALLVGGGHPTVAAAAPSTPITADASAGPTPPPSGAPSADPSAEPNLAEVPEPTPAPTPTPTPAPPAWTRPATVKGFADCWSVVAAIDDQGTSHVAGTCQKGDRLQVRYSVSSDTRSWKTTAFKLPADRLELSPQLAVSGNRLYLAYTRDAQEDGGCGDDGLRDLGVYYRTRTLPNGTWSAPTRIGNVGDALGSFRVKGSVLHATVTNEKAGTTTYETVTAGHLARYPIKDAFGSTSLRVDNDGLGRIAYAGKGGIRYAQLDGTHLAAVTIPDTLGGSYPALILGPDNEPSILWSRSSYGGEGGCADGGEDKDPTAGTYLSIHGDDGWVTTRISKLIGTSSLAMDPATGELHVVVSDERRMVYYHRLPGHDWEHKNFAVKNPSSPVIRLDPRSGDLVLAFSTYDDDTDGRSNVEVVAYR